MTVLACASHQNVNFAMQALSRHCLNKMCYLFGWSLINKKQNPKFRSINQLFWVHYFSCVYEPIKRNKWWSKQRLISSFFSSSKWVEVFVSHFLSQKMNSLIISDSFLSRNTFFIENFGSMNESWILWLGILQW